MAPKKIVIIGGGAIGTSTAYFLTHHNLYDPKVHTVTILEASKIADGASGKSGGLLAQWATPKCLAPLSFKTHAELAKKHGGEKLWGYRNVYCAEVDLDVREPDSTRGVPSSDPGKYSADKFPKALDWLRPGCLKTYKQIGTPANSAQVHSYLYTTSLAKFAEDKGAKILFGRATKINYSADSKAVVSVSYIADGEHDLEATDILIAAGPWTPGIFPRANLLAPRGHSVVVRPVREVSEYVLFPIIESDDGLVSPEIYPWPKDGANDFGTVYASGPDDYGVPLPGSSEEVVVDEKRCGDVWDALKSVSKEISDGEVLVKQACYKPQIRQHEEDEEVGPMVGPTGIDGLWIATGHDEWGMQNSAGTGLVMSEMILEGKARSADCAALDPKHFLEAE